MLPMNSLYVFWNAQEHIGLTQPHLLRVHEGTPGRTSHAGRRSIAEGGGIPQLVSDNVYILLLIRGGTEDARDYVCIGCGSGQ